MGATGCYMKQNLQIAIMAHFLRSPTKILAKIPSNYGKDLFSFGPQLVFYLDRKCCCCTGGHWCWEFVKGGHRPLKVENHFSRTSDCWQILESWFSFFAQNFRSKVRFCEFSISKIVRSFLQSVGDFQDCIKKAELLQFFLVIVTKNKNA